MINNHFGITEESFQKIYNFFTSHTEIETVIIFRSRAKGNYTKGSDIDIALVGENITALDALTVSAALNKQLSVPYYFDILNYNNIKQPELIEHINRVGKILYKKEIAENF